MLRMRFRWHFIGFIASFFFLLFVGDTFYFRTRPHIPKSSKPLSIIPSYRDNQRNDLTISLASTPSHDMRDGIA